MPPTRQLVGNKILCPACLVKEKKIRRREENPWGSSTFFETPKYPRATDIRSHSVFEVILMESRHNTVLLFVLSMDFSFSCCGVQEVGGHLS